MQYNVTYRQKDKGIQTIVSYKVGNTWKQKSKQGFKTKALAKIGAEKILEELKKTNLEFISADYNTVTFKNIVDIYVEHSKIHNTSNTIVTIKNTFNMFAALNDTKIKDINTMDLQIIFDELIKQGYQPSTLKMKKAHLNTLFNFIVTKYNVGSKVIFKNIKITSSKTTRDRTALTKDELMNIIEEATKDKYKIIFMLAGMCGLRIGEICGLTYDCINFKTGELTVNKQWKLVGDNNTYNFGELKSKNSYRTLPVPPVVIKALMEYKLNNPTSIDNRVLNINSTASVTSMLRTYFKRRNFNISIHELRHTYATILISNGTDFKTTANLLGHDVEMTMKTYSHVTSDMKTKVANTIKAIF